MNFSPTVPNPPLENDTRRPAAEPLIGTGACASTRAGEASSNPGSPRYDGLNVPIVECGARGIVVNANSFICSLFGYEIDELVGKNVSVLMPEVYGKRHDLYMTNYEKNRNTNVFGHPRKLQGKRKDGTLFPLEITLGVRDTDASELSENFVAVIRALPPKEMALAQRTRFERDFDMVEIVGSGSFGCVFKCRNKLDAELYAVKKIQIELKSSKRERKGSKKRLAHEKGDRTSEDPSPGVGQTDNLVEETVENASDTELVSFDEKDADEGDSLRNEKEVGEECAENSFSHRKGENEGSGADQLFPGEVDRRDSDQVQRRLKEAAVLAKLPSHPNVVRYYTCWVQLGSQILNSPAAARDAQLFIQMEYCGQLSLKKWIRRPGRLIDIRESLDIFVQICRGLEHIHSQGYIHRDIKPANILLSEVPEMGRKQSLNPSRWRAKIGDFGLATVTRRVDSANENLLYREMFPTGRNSSRSRTSRVGTRLYSAPEQLNSNVYDSKADIFALGCVFMELLCPFANKEDRYTALQNLRRGQVPSSMINNYSELVPLARAMVAPSPPFRPSASGLLCHPLILACNGEDNSMSPRAKRKIARRPLIRRFPGRFQNFSSASEDELQRIFPGQCPPKGSSDQESSTELSRSKKAPNTRQQETDTVLASWAFANEIDSSGSQSDPLAVERVASPEDFSLYSNSSLSECERAEIEDNVSSLLLSSASKVGPGSKKAVMPVETPFKLALEVERQARVIEQLTAELRILRRKNDDLTAAVKQHEALASKSVESKDL